jgi:hypothetical protein
MHDTDVHPVVAGHDRTFYYARGKGIVSRRKEWRLRLIAYIEARGKPVSRKGATSGQRGSCAKRGRDWREKTTERWN